MTLQTIAGSAVVRQFHDDWLLWNVYADGSVREFNTELWPEHDRGQNWTAVERAAASGKRDRAGRLSRFRLDIPEVDAATFFRLSNSWFESLGDWPTDAQLYVPEPPA